MMRAIAVFFDHDDMCVTTSEGGYGMNGNYTTRVE